MTLHSWELDPAQRSGVATLRSGAVTDGPGARRAPERGGRTRLWLILVLGLASLVALIIAGVLIGSVGLSPSLVVRICLHRICGDACVTPDWTRAQDLIVASTRLPRVLLAAVCGAGLSVAGTLIQALVRNPLAGPGVLGVSSGAATGAVVILRFASLGALGAVTLNIGAFVGALAAMVVVLAISHAKGHVDAARLILGGTAVSSILSAVTSLIIITAPDQTLAGQVLQWNLGGFGGATWHNLIAPAIAVTGLLIVLMPLGRLLNLSIMGDDAAISLGLNIELFRKVMIVVTAMVVSIIVSVSGVISFVGLMLPHMARLLVGSDHRRALPVAAVLGAAFMVATDLVARTIASPSELPVGIITSIIGGPVFIVLIRRRLRSTT